jgi:hypothetical protein
MVSRWLEAFSVNPSSFAVVPVVRKYPTTMLVLDATTTNAITSHFSMRHHLVEGD